jgi:hypothetical protein
LGFSILGCVSCAWGQPMLWDAAPTHWERSPFISVESEAGLTVRFPYETDNVTMADEKPLCQTQPALKEGELEAMRDGMEHAIKIVTPKKAWTPRKRRTTDVNVG